MSAERPWIGSLLVLTACFHFQVKPPESESNPASLMDELPLGLRIDPASITIAPFDSAGVRPVGRELDNGLVVYVVTESVAPMVDVQLLLPVGAVDDPPDQVGLTALMAQLLIQGGTKDLSPEALEALLEGQAAVLGGGARDEYTTLSLSVTSESMARLFPVFMEILMRPRFDAARFEVAVDQLREAIRRRDDSPESTARRALDKAVFGPSSPLAREPQEDAVRGVALEDVKRHFAASVGPKGARLLVTGDVDVEVLEKLIRQYVEPWRGGLGPERKHEAPPALSRRVIVVPHDTSQAKVRLGGRGFRRGSNDEYASRLANEVLGGFGVGRLYRRLRVERPLAYTVFSSVSPGPTTGIFAAGFDTRPENVREALSIALATLEAVGTAEPIAPEELRLAKEASNNAFVFHFERAALVAFESALTDLHRYPVDHWASFQSRMNAATAQEAQKAAVAMVQDLQIVVVGPPEQLGDLSIFGPVSVIRDVGEFR